MTPLWIGFWLCLLLLVIFVGYVALAAIDPEGRGGAHTDAAFIGSVVLALVCAGFVGALLHRHFA